MDSSDRNRLSVTLVDVAEGKEADFVALASQFGALLVRKKYGISEMIRDEAHPLRFYSVRRWNDAAAAASFVLGEDLQLGNPARNLVTSYLNAAGIEAGYGFFSPNVPIAQRRPSSASVRRSSAGAATVTLFETVITFGAAGAALPRPVPRPRVGVGVRGVRAAGFSAVW